MTAGPKLQGVQSSPRPSALRRARAPSAAAPALSCSIHQSDRAWVFALEEHFLL